MEILKLSRGDHGFDWLFEIKKANGSSYDASGNTARIYIWDPQSSTNILLSNTATLVSASIGGIAYSINSGDFLTQGSYFGEIQVMATGMQQSTKVFKAIVADSPTP